MERYQPLLERAGELGTSARRYVYNLEQHLPDLLGRLEKAGWLERIHLWNVTDRVAEEMATVAALGEDVEAKQADLGCYFGLQFLHQALHSLAMLRFQVRTREDRHPVHRDFLERTGAAFEGLVASYVEQLASLAFGRENRPLFALFAVGAPGHLGDIDLGVIDDGSPAREALHKVLTRLAPEMLRRAVAPHFGVSEHVGGPRVTASIEEYRELLDHRLQDPELIAQMVGGRHLLGSERLFADFREQVTRRYFYDPDRDTRHHGAFLRGLLGEIRALRLRSTPAREIHLHDDGLRLCQALATALRVVNGVTRVDRAGLFQELWEKDFKRHTVYVELERSLVFQETFRLLHQLLIGEGDRVHLHGVEDLAALRPVALAMGWKDTGPVRAEQRLLIRWQEEVERVRDLTDRLLPFLTGHLGRLPTGVASLTAADRPPEENLADRVGQVLHFRRGARYWDDLLPLFEQEDAAFLRLFARDLNALEPAARAEVIEEIALWGKSTFYSIIRLLTALHRHGLRAGAPGLFGEVTGAMLAVLENNSNEKRRLANVFRRYPQLVGPFILSLPAEHLVALERLVAGEMFQEELVPWQKRLQRLLRLGRRTSHYFRRYLRRVVAGCPQVASCIEDTRELELLARGMLGDSEFASDAPERKRHLGEFYEVKFLCAALQTLGGARHWRVGRDFARFTNDYVESLFDACRRELKEELQVERDLGDRLAIFVTGGHARGQAYDDDYDILVLLDSTDPEDRVFTERIVKRMNREMAARGLIPHFRSAEWAGGYVLTLRELAERLETDAPDLFIDMSQLLEMGCVVGSRSFQSRLTERILEPLVLERSAAYGRAVVGEVRSRRAAGLDLPPATLDIKEGPGGLREIELVALTAKAHLRRLEGSLDEALERLADARPDLAERLRALGETNKLLNHVRAAYRLSVAASNEIDLELLDEVAPIVGSRSGEEVAWRLQKEVDRAAELVVELLEELVGTAV